MDYRNRKRRAIIACLFAVTALVQKVTSEDVFLPIPSELIFDEGGHYRLDYRPPYGNPPPNSTFSPLRVADGIQLTRVLPGTRYDFRLYYKNDSFTDYLIFEDSITTVPPPPSNLTIDVRGGRSALVSWDPPGTGSYTGFKLKVIPLSEPKKTEVFTVKAQPPFPIKNLTSGASYELQLHTFYDGMESSAYISSNFTTRPNAPGRFIVWYRNETTMLVLWQPPYPAGFYSHYRVSIDPKDARESVKTVLRLGEPPGPAQASFLGLVPGRAYNITVETVSHDQISLPTTAQYRTIPLAPRNITFDPKFITTSSFVAKWEAPKGIGEFNRYQLSLGVRKKVPPLIIDGDAPREATFEGLEPGKTYNVLIKTVSGIVASWPTTANVTTRPLPVTDLQARENEATHEVTLTWKDAENSIQDHYKALYQEVEVFNGDSRTKVVLDTVDVEELYPGRNYSLSVFAMSNNIESEPTIGYIATKPAPPIIEELQSIPQGLNISWKSDVTSRQDKYAIVYARNNTGKSITRQTVDSHITLTDLFPGAGYEVKVYAISHGLWSDPHINFQAVYPNPVRSLTITEVSNTSITLSWQAPIESLFTHYIVRYRTTEAESWTNLPAINTTGATVDNLEPGERYVIQVRSVSYHVESFTAEEVERTVPPNPVKGISYQLDSQNITFEWPRPEGRIDYYTFVWWNAATPERKKSKEVSGTQATEGIERKLTVLVGELRPGELYNFEIYTTAHNVKSETVTLSLRTMPVITSDITIVNQLETRSFTVIYTPTPSTDATFDKYRFMLSDPSIPVKEKISEDTDRKIIFERLVPGRLYNITAWTVSGDVTSQPLIRQDRLYPEPVSDINATLITDTAIHLSWTKPEGYYDTFEVQYLTEDGLLTNQTDRPSISLTHLRPYHNYTFTVLTRAGDVEHIMRQSTSVSATFATSESIPGQVEIFMPVEIRPNLVRFNWSLPQEEENGVLSEFTIKYGIKNSSVMNEEKFNPEEFSGTIRGLIPGETYTFQIEARNKKGPGRIKTYELTMPIWSPPEPNDKVFPTEVSHTSATIRIRFRENYFSSENGNIIGYSVIVAEDDTKHSKGLELPAWKDVQGYTVWPPYQVNEAYYPFTSTLVEDFIIGNESDCKNAEGYCNGPLKPGTSYKVKIRAYTSRDKFADTVFTDFIRTDSESGSIGMAVGIPIVVVILIVVFVMIMRRRSCRLQKRNSDIDMGLPDIKTRRPIKLKNFEAYYEFMSADSDYRFAEEYEALKYVGHDLPRTAADLPVNRPKNRFTNILPYDITRVKLQPTDDEEGSDYINANYVSGYNSPREFVVTQGPLPSTCDDFWRMCWESNSRAIIMLTQCIERGRERCHHYWPYDRRPIYYGDIRVAIVKEQQFPDWNISEFNVSKGDVCRIVRHFHFTTWPDFGVPDPPHTLVSFVREFRQLVGPDQKPIIVHCSAGVGRSGTFIAIDKLLFTMEISDEVDIFGIVYNMRRERVSMVQAEQQYICIHQCVLAVLHQRDKEYSPKEIHDNPGFDDDEGIVDLGM
ncbi:tyrosine-protein phosphatase 10D-like [Macrobrachium rosenbergii]|uniref:tyrosine-protein phosphatase 10D-like n=1 Tax=Macrobrachium rosenbergii TaxID=79674 RepID=UPI0034D5FBEB